MKTFKDLHIEAMELERKRAIKKLIYAIISLILYIVSITLCFMWFDYKLFLFIFFFISASNFQRLSD